jgi:hypothetical protein
MFEKLTIILLSSDKINFSFRWLQYMNVTEGKSPILIAGCGEINNDSLEKK